MSLRKFLVLNAILTSGVVTGAHADELDTLQFRAGQSWQYDSNVFRLSDSVGNQAALGSSGRSDNVFVTTVGAKIDKRYSLQRFEFDISANRSIYNNFSRLDFSAVNYAAAWRWSITPALYGNFTTDRRVYTDNTSDVQILGQLNRRTDRSTLLDAEYAIDGPWRALAGVFQRTNTNSQPFVFEGDSKVQGVEVGARYVFGSDASLAYRLKQGSGEYPGRVLSSTFASNFKDREHEFRVNWPITGKTTIQSRLSYFDRSHDGLAARDFSGFTGQLDSTWQITGKTGVTGGFVRELASYQTSTASYYTGNRLFIAPVWKPTEKTAVKFRYDHGRRSYNGPLPGFASTDRRDTTNVSSLGFEWDVIRAVKISSSVFTDRRKSSEPGADYKSNGVNLSVLASF
ncbi:MAG: putative exosortase B-associated extracellular polysaccharide biosynthesis transporter EpsL [Polaromonas sp.]|nr:putative exosortase B-associated extracellular polysaccharide biosynthesis transporter EpsL [Polaromonas sp.]